MPMTNQSNDRLLLLVTIAKELESAQRAKRLQDRSQLWKPRATPATDLGYRCERRIVYHRTIPEKAAPISEELASIFTEGKEQERLVKAELASLGCDVVSAEVSFFDERLDVSGNIDGKLPLRDVMQALGISIEGLNLSHRERVPLEVKSTGGNPPRTDLELAMHRGLYGRYWCQMQTYLYLTEEWHGLFLFKNKQTGLWSVVPSSLNLEQMEQLAQKAERVRDAVRAGDLPERLLDRSECPACPWRDTVCHPEEHAPDPLLIATDEELAAQIRERESLDPARKRFAVIDKELKTRFKATKGTRFFCSDYIIEKKPHGKGTRVDFKRLAEEAAENEGTAVEAGHPLEEQ
jgi:hypothetical protein